jgi:hypothetical protein
MSFRFEVVKEHLDVFDKRAELLPRNDTVVASDVYVLAVRSEPAGGGSVTMATGPAVPAEGEHGASGSEKSAGLSQFLEVATNSTEASSPDAVDIPTAARRRARCRVRRRRPRRGWAVDRLPNPQLHG